MRLLLDAHTLLWFSAGSSQLSKTARAAIEGDDNHSYVSDASLWELAIKSSLGKLELLPDFATYVQRAVTGNGFRSLPISIDHIAKVVTLPHHHRDPFDRMLIAQAAVEELTIISSDPLLDAYAARRIW